MEVKHLLIPNKPHLDPIVAVYLLLKYGQEQFPNIREADIMYWQESHDPSEAEFKDFEANGTLMIDIAGGLFDHHKEEGETAATLVAKYLKIESNPELSALLGYIREDDLQGLHNRYGDIAYLLKCMYKQDIAQDEVVATALKLINYFQISQQEWHVAVKEEFDSKCQIIKVKRNKQRLKIGVIESDNKQVGNFGLTVRNLAAVVQKRSTGHVYIQTNKYYRINLKEIVAAIRKRELEFSGFEGEIDPQKLQFEGKNAQVPNWFYHLSLNAFLNGSDSFNKSEPTKVPLDEIVRFVIYGVSTEESKLCDCDKGGEKCPYVKYGFSRCYRKKQGTDFTYFK